ncbi:hypothetical protein [Paraburkholderia rhizosphaerae]|nr:hypothetical protein [Paraburkholderia rhizosphaerae]
MKRLSILAISIVIAIIVVNALGDEWRSEVRAFLRAMRHAL